MPWREPSPRTDAVEVLLRVEQSRSVNLVRDLMLRQFYLCFEGFSAGGSVPLRCRCVSVRASLQRPPPFPCAPPPSATPVPLFCYVLCRRIEVVHS